MKPFILEKPLLQRVDKKKIADLFLDSTYKDSAALYQWLSHSSDPEYVYWDKMKQKPALPFLSSEEAWYLLKVFRKNHQEMSPIKTEKGEYFRWVKLDRYNEFFHFVDLHAGGDLFSFHGDEKKRLQFVSRGIMEESIASSQLEGASTSRRTAKEMIRSGRKPRNTAERMILNNYAAMQAIEQDFKKKKLSVELLLELHTMLTQGTLEDPNDVGRFDTDAGRVSVVNDSHDMILHQPPRMEFVKEELFKLIGLANDELTPLNFVHPVAKAIMLHFWIGYLHPFGDGNGRLARALFYWYLLRHDYWAFSYLPISSLIKRSPGQYIKAYIYSEQDDNDLTYFIDYNIRVIQKAIEQFKEYTAVQYEKNVKVRRLVGDQYALNDRQIDLLKYFSDGDLNKSTQAKIYQKMHQISFPTVSSDLKKLEKIGFLERKKNGRNVYYYPTKKVVELFQ